jgi:hypothetical protein
VKVKTVGAECNAKLKSVPKAAQIVKSRCPTFQVQLELFWVRTNLKANEVQIQKDGTTQKSGNEAKSI